MTNTSISKYLYRVYEAEAMWVAQTLAEMAIKYKSVGADKIVSISAKEVYNEQTN